MKSEKGHIYYLKPRSTEYKIVADLPDSNKGAEDDYFIVSGNWEFQPNDDLHLYPLSRTVFGEGAGKGHASQVSLLSCIKFSTFLL